MSLVTFFFFSGALLSFTCLAFMLGYRFWELKAGKVELPHRTFRGFAHALLVVEKEKLEKVWSATRNYGEMCLAYMSEQAEKLTASKHFKKTTDILRGKHIPMIGKNPSSPFFKAMLEYKEQVRKVSRKGITIENNF